MTFCNHHHYHHPHVLFRSFFQFFSSLIILLLLGIGSELHPHHHNLVNARIHPAYSQESIACNGSTAFDASNHQVSPQWMSTLSDSIPLNELSLPGTHDTMALYGGEQFQCQTMSLEAQLESGIRALDIRCRHVGNRFMIYHAFVYQHATMYDVLDVCRKFLRTNPTETLVMRIKQEWLPEANTRTFEQTFRTEYLSVFEDIFWLPPPNLNDTTTTATNDSNGYYYYDSSPVSSSSNYYPTLGEVRGKIVVLQDFDTTTVTGGNSTIVESLTGSITSGIAATITSDDNVNYLVRGVHYMLFSANTDGNYSGGNDNHHKQSPMGAYGPRWSHIVMQDEYTLITMWSLYSKWNKVKQQLYIANAAMMMIDGDDDGNDINDIHRKSNITKKQQQQETPLYVNFLSGSVGVKPYFVASGHTGWGTDGDRQYFGIISASATNQYADFPRTTCMLGGRFCLVYFEGTNILTYERLRAETNIQHVGIVFADFPGCGLIRAIIDVNYRRNSHHRRRHLRHHRNRW